MLMATTVVVERIKEDMIVLMMRSSQECAQGNDRVRNTKL
jgi:hypothetical protein